MSTKDESNLPTEHKWMHKFTQQQVEKRANILTDHTSCVRMLTLYESNLQAKHKQMHKFTQQQVEKREIIDTELHILC